MPARNAAATLGESLESLAVQSFKDFELVLVNDGSSDETVAIAERFAGRLNLRLVHHESSLGVARWHVNWSSCARTRRWVCAARMCWCSRASMISASC
jgi:cellulose synthase/poly-beta-1,6-N-acetylglucosamine synthase-like glycosyltransferase